MRHKEPSVEILQQRAEILRNIREFFYLRKVMEVDVPVIGRYSVSDPHLDALSVNIDSQAYYLQTSPEYFMKRLLAHDCGDIYYMGKAFRKDEKGRLHNSEFTMLEWYRIGFNDQTLMDEICDLLISLKPALNIERLSYRDVFIGACGIDPHSASVDALKLIAREKLDVRWSDSDKNLWIDLLFTHLVEPSLSDRVCFVYDFPASQCALAKVDADESEVFVAKRFELYWHGVELANGYAELTDLDQQVRRFQQDNATRSTMNKPSVEIDADFLAAMAIGMPECAGVALGLDRLVMMLLNLNDIQEQSITI